jgi:hypothetical protein
MSVEIPADLQPLLQQVVANGGYADEQAAVTAILRVAAGSFESYQQMKTGVEKSLVDEREGRVKPADFDQLRQQLSDSSDS